MYPLTIPILVHILVMARQIAPESVVSGYDGQGGGQAVLDAAFTHEQVEVTVDVPTHGNGLCFGKLEISIIPVILSSPDSA